MELSEVGLVGLSIIIPLSMSSTLASRTSYADRPLSRCLVDLEALYAKVIAMQFYQWRQNERRYLCDPRVGTCRARDTTSPVMFFRCMPFLSRHCIAPSSVSSPRLYMHDSLRDSDRGCFLTASRPIRCNHREGHDTKECSLSRGHVDYIVPVVPL